MSKLTDKDREKLPQSNFAFPKKRKEPLVDARHVQEAIARFSMRPDNDTGVSTFGQSGRKEVLDQVKGVTNKERDEAWKRIAQAAKKFEIELQEKDWRS